MRKLVLMLICAFLFIFLFEVCYAEIREEIGYACDPNVEVAKKKALKKAEEEAVKKYVGVLIESRTLVIKGKLARKIIQSVALGKIKVIDEQILAHEFLEKKGLICIKVKAKLEINKSQFYRSNFGLRMVLNKDEFKSGELLKVYLYSKKRCYPYLFSVDAKGNVFRILPNSVEKSPTLEGKMVFPTKKMESSGITLAVYADPQNSSPRQIEELVLVCTRKKEDVLLKLFPEAFVPNPEEIKKNIPIFSIFPHTAEKLAEILNQIGLENYEMIDDFYIVTK